MMLLYSIKYIVYEQFYISLIVIKQIISNLLLVLVFPLAQYVFEYRYLVMLSIVYNYDHFKGPVQILKSYLFHKLMC